MQSIIFGNFFICVEDSSYMKDYIKPDVKLAEDNNFFAFALSAPWHNLFTRKKLNVDLKETLILKDLIHFKDETKYILIEKIYY